jgi:hypothetical protein
MDRTYSTSSPKSRTATRGAGTSGLTDLETNLRHDSDVGDYDSYDSYEDYDDYDDGNDEIYEYEDPIDRRWIWVAGVAGAILLIAVICTVVILGGGDSGSVSKTIIATTATTPPVATSTAPPVMTSAAPPPAPVAPLSPETVTTVAPSPSPTASADPAPAVAAPSPNAITYQVTGTRQLLDLVTVVYTDAQGALQTEFNIALPWSRTVTLDPGVQLKSVTATSLTGQLNCSITDGSGAAIVAQATNSMITTCTK